jgi:hypothetical protein
MRLVLSIVAVVIGACVAAVLAGTASWNRATGVAVEQLAASSPGPAIDAAMLDQLPPPVARYFRRVLHDDHPIVRSAAATQQAEFFINGQWRPLKATQDFSISPPGFVWDARITMAPLMPVFVRDAYVDGHGSMKASMLGVYPIVDAAGKPELDAGALQRLLGEAIWFPTALLPSSSVTWSARDDRSALVTLRDRATAVTLLFEFGEDAVPVTISGERYMEQDGQYNLRPWQIQCGEYRVKDAMLIPMRCEVAWIIDGAPQPYWRGRITSITYRYN